MTDLDLHCAGLVPLWVEWWYLCCSSSSLDPLGYFGVTRLHHCFVPASVSSFISWLSWNCWCSVLAALCFPSSSGTFCFLVITFCSTRPGISRLSPLLLFLPFVWLPSLLSCPASCYILVPSTFLTPYCSAVSRLCLLHIRGAQAKGSRKQQTRLSSCCHFQCLVFGRWEQQLQGKSC